MSRTRPQLRRQWPVIGLIGLMSCGRGPERAEASPQGAQGSQVESLQGTLDVLTTELEVRVALLDLLGVDGLGIHARIAGGEVTLTGEVASTRSMILADEAVSGLSWVTAVHDQLTVEPSRAGRGDDDGRLHQELADELLGARVKLRLFSRLGLEASRIDVVARDGSVTLIGDLSTPQEYIAAVTSAESTEGCLEVVDEVDVPR